MTAPNDPFADLPIFWRTPVGGEGMEWLYAAGAVGTVGGEDGFVQFRSIP